AVVITRVGRRPGQPNQRGNLLGRVRKRTRERLGPLGLPQLPPHEGQRGGKVGAARRQAVTVHRDPSNRDQVRLALPGERAQRGAHLVQRGGIGSGPFQDAVLPLWVGEQRGGAFGLPGRGEHLRV